MSDVGSGVQCVGPRYEALIGVISDDDNDWRRASSRPMALL